MLVSVSPQRGFGGYSSTKGQGVSFFEILITACPRQPPTVPIAIVMGVTRLPGHKLSDSETDREKVIGC